MCACVRACVSASTHVCVRARARRFHLRQNYSADVFGGDFSANAWIEHHGMFKASEQCTPAKRLQ